MENICHKQYTVDNAAKRCKIVMKREVYIMRSFNGTKAYYYFSQSFYFSAGVL